jgi:hypothetical protein
VESKIWSLFHEALGWLRRRIRSFSISARDIGVVFFPFVLERRVEKALKHGSVRGWLIALILISSHMNISVFLPYTMHLYYIHIVGTQENEAYIRAYLSSHFVTLHYPEIIVYSYTIPSLLLFKNRQPSPWGLYHLPTLPHFPYYHVSAISSL